MQYWKSWNVRGIRIIRYWRGNKVRAKILIAKQLETLEPWGDNGIEFLRCTDGDCLNRYKIEYDDRDRIIRGDKE
jgi:hypothetical protein